MNTIKWKRMNDPMSPLRGYRTECGRFMVWKERLNHFSHQWDGSGDGVTPSGRIYWVNNVSSHKFENVTGARLECEAIGDCWGWMWHVSRKVPARVLPTYAGSKTKLFETKEQAEMYGAILLMKA